MIRPNKHGMYFYKGKYQTSQSIHFEEYLKPFLEKEQFTHIIEIGTFLGGLTLFLRDTLPDAVITTYDVQSEEQLVVGFLRENNVEFLQEDIFDHPHVVSTTFLDKMNEADKLLICVDGGNKPAEFSSIAPLLSSGDTIMVHDYVKDQAMAAQFDKEGKWHWFETFEKDIAGSCEQFNLEPIYPELQEVVWAVRRKV